MVMLSQRYMAIEVKDGVIAGDVHSGDVHNTTVTNIHHSPIPKQEIKLNWWGVKVTRNQYFMTYYIFMTLSAAFVGWMFAIVGLHNPVDNIGGIVFFGAIIAWSIEAAIMNNKFSKAEE